MIVTLSRQLGSQGDTIATRVAAALGLGLVDRDHIFQSALAAGVPADKLHKLMYRGVRNLAGEIVDSLGGPQSGQSVGPMPLPNPFGGMLAPMLMPASLDLDEAVRMIGLIVTDVASQGSVLFLGQGAQMTLRGYSGVCHVQVLAPIEQRVERVMASEALSVAQARRLVKSSDETRGNYLARYHGVNWLDPLLYHVVLNTGLISVEAAVSLIVHAAQVVRTGD